jgi:hypothetical protein
VLSVKKLKPMILLLSNEKENVTSRAPGPGEGKCRINLKQVDLKALAVKWVKAWWQQGKPENLIQLIAPRGNAGGDDEEEAEGGDDDDEAMDDGAGDGAPQESDPRPDKPTAGGRDLRLRCRFLLCDSATRERMNSPA